MNITAETAMPRLPAQQPPRTDKPLVPVGTGAIEAFASASNFEQAWRMAQALSSSDLVPEATTAISLLILCRSRSTSPLAFAGGCDGRHAKSGCDPRAPVLALRRSSLPRSTPAGNFRRCASNSRARAWHASALPGQRTDPASGWKGRKFRWRWRSAEGWLEKNGSKWKTLPELMLRCRAAGVLRTAVCVPEILLGMQTAEEGLGRDRRDATTC